MFAGHSTGNMGIVARADQERVYRTLASLGYAGLLAVHCEKESLLRPDAWDPSRPSSHARARPPAAEVASVDDQIALARAAGFRGTLHVCHLSTPWALDLLRRTHAPPDPAPGFPVTCGLTPHHALLDASMMDSPRGALLKVNPPLRPKPMPALLLKRLAAGAIDWIETDHAPHALTEKSGAGAASGIPVLPFYPAFVKLLLDRGMPRPLIEELTHEGICRAFGLAVPKSGRPPDYRLAGEYPFDPFAVSGAAR